MKNLPGDAILSFLSKIESGVKFVIKIPSNVSFSSLKDGKTNDCDFKHHEDHDDGYE